ncbi:hypothetical protein [Pyrolobus fumarii]|nr:hypothetical protein [Pyrolobus fumarii]
MSTAKQAEKVDFLRHIVNRVLAEHSLPRQIVDDVRKSIGYAEEKYKFSAFGGDPRRLADYLRSRDFDDVVTVLRGAKAEEVLIHILEEVKKRYSEYKEVVEAAEARLKELKGVVGEKPETKLGLVYNALRNLEERGVEVKLEGEEVRARLYGPVSFEMRVKYDQTKRNYTAEFKLEGKTVAETTAKLYEIATKLVDLAKSLQQP